MAEVVPLSLEEAASAIASGKVTSVQLTERAVEALSTLGETLGCVAGLDAETALAQAHDMDLELQRKGLRGSLHGVPLAHKDMFYRAGRVSACGSRIRANFTPDHTATVLQRLDAAGALDVARLNMVEFAYGPTGHNEFTGTPRNPWNTQYITGGSSSGPAAAVAAGLVFASLGSDTGGSVRIPATCCSLVGMKPTYGRVSRYGSMGLSYTLDHPGTLTRTVRDCALMLNVISGHDPSDATTEPRAVPDFVSALGRPIDDLRVAVPTNYFYDPVVPSVKAVLDASLEVLRTLGATVVPVTIPSIELANPMVMLIMAVEAAALHGRWLRERPDDYSAQTLSRLLPGLLYPATQYVDALNLRQRVLADFSEAVFAKADVLHLPVLPVQVPTIAESDLALNPRFSEFMLHFGHCTRPFNYLGLPAMSVPAGFTENGLPCGFQLVGRPFDEETLLQVAFAYEQQTHITSRRPPLHA